MKKLLQIILILALALPVWFVGSVTPVYAQEAMCEHTPVKIDIKPGVYPNKINLSSRGLLAVAVLSTEDFDARQFTPEMAHLSDAAAAESEGCMGAEAVRWTYTDVNCDGRTDLLFFFRIRDLNLTPASTAATLMAHGTYGPDALHIAGTDSVRVRP